MKSHEMEL